MRTIALAVAACTLILGCAPPPIDIDQMPETRMTEASPELVAEARLGSRKYHDVITEQTDPRGNPYIWIGGNGPTWELTPGTDATLIREGYVAVTPLRVDLTQDSMLANLADLNHDGPLKR